MLLLHVLLVSVALSALAPSGAPAPGAPARPGGDGAREGVPAAASVLVGVTPGSKRGLPLLGFGNEATLQNVDDGLLAAAAAAAGSRVLRYPGGAPSNTWDWALGCCLNQSDPATAACTRAAWNDEGGYGTATPTQWARYANRSGSPLTVFDLNVVTSNASHQVAGLRALAAHGVPVTHVELGNELYDGQQNLGRWSDGAGYAAAMLPFLAAARAAFPAALTAVVGSGWWPGMDPRWNSQVLSGTTANATTLHFYTSLDTVGITAATAAARAPGLFAAAFATAERIVADAEAQIPARLRIWVTELGHYGTYAPNNWATKEIDGTWLEGLYSGAALLLVLQTSRVDVVLPYCLVCADANAPAFTTGEPWGSLLPANESGRHQWSPTPRGAVLGAVMAAVNAARAASGGGGGGVAMQALDFWQADQQAGRGGPGCGQAGIGAGGYCIHDELSATACACRSLCANHSGCAAWQWIASPPSAKDHQTCYLKSVVDLSPEPNSVSGACWSSNGTACLPPRPPPLNQTLLGWVFTQGGPAGSAGSVGLAGGVVGAVMLHLGGRAVTLDLSGLFDQSSSAGGWAVTAQYQSGGGGALLGNMSTVVRQVTLVASAEQARRLTVPPFAVVSIKTAPSRLTSRDRAHGT